LFAIWVVIPVRVLLENGAYGMQQEAKHLGVYWPLCYTNEVIDVHLCQ
jgi:hypothetical protein